MSTSMMPEPVERYASAAEPVARNTSAEERALLGRALVYPSAIPDDVLALPAEYFTGERHRTLWRVLVDRAAAGLDADVPAVAAEVAHIPGAADYVSGLARDAIGAVPTTPATLARAITDGHRARTVERALLGAWQRLAAGNVDDAMRVMVDLDPTVGQVDTGTTVTEAWEEVCEEAASGERVVQVPAPWPTLTRDYLLGGWRGGELYVLGGSPGTGKTASAQQIIAHAAEQGVVVSAFSLEMSRADLVRRLMSTAAGVHMGEVMRPDLNMRKESWEQVRASVERIGDRIIVHDDVEITAEKLRDIARVDYRRHGAGLIVVDYAQLVELEDAHRLDDRQVIERVIKRLKALARELRIPVVALAQTNRNAEIADRPLTKADLLGSGALERYAAMVILLNAVREGDEKRVVAVDFDIDKNRYAQTGKIRMVADLAHQRFEEL